MPSFLFYCFFKKLNSLVTLFYSQLDIIDFVRKIEKRE